MWDVNYEGSYVVDPAAEHRFRNSIAIVMEVHSSFVVQGRVIDVEKFISTPKDDLLPC